VLTREQKMWGKKYNNNQRVRKKNKKLLSSFSSRTKRGRESSRKKISVELKELIAMSINNCWLTSVCVFAQGGSLNEKKLILENGIVKRWWFASYEASASNNVWIKSWYRLWRTLSVGNFSWSLSRKLLCCVFIRVLNYIYIFFFSRSLSCEVVLSLIIFALLSLFFSQDLFSPSLKLKWNQSWWRSNFFIVLIPRKIHQEKIAKIPRKTPSCTYAFHRKIFTWARNYFILKIFSRLQEIIIFQFVNWICRGIHNAAAFAFTQRAKRRNVEVFFCSVGVSYPQEKFLIFTRLIIFDEKLWCERGEKNRFSARVAKAV
jgi:hypothetical protein